MNYNAETIKNYLSSDADVVFFESVDSTNNVLKSLAESGAREGTVVVARTQTAGKGTKGRSFSSPAGGGIYLSILLRPSEKNGTALITPSAALAVRNAVGNITGRSPYVKWVNDVIFDGKKICGILAESKYLPGSLFPEYVVVGIGVNVFEPEGGFPEEIRDIAGAVFSCAGRAAEDTMPKLASKIIDEYLSLYKEKNKKALVDAYRESLFMLGKRVKVIKADRTEEATALDIDRECRLLVRYDDGREEYLSSAEVSCRLV